MTRITVFYRNGRLVGFDAFGHAGYAESGEDIVCASISAITQTAALGIAELVRCKADLDMNDGRLSLILDKTVEGEPLEKAELVLRTMLLGLRSVKEDYSNYLKLIEREV